MQFCKTYKDFKFKIPSRAHALLFFSADIIRRSAELGFRTEETEEEEIDTKYPFLSFSGFKFDRLNLKFNNNLFCTQNAFQ